ncbi:hypothetical protein CAFE_23670 [Caprobacter fermentans]|uniref:Uncharacterized protein n=1 Tax=Caproicibacter fermentans TaxID=2576756 RepID=A0A6N8I1B3_9FIRM|nr:hypothetical protein [Caproicibacter fermentans]MVB11645.1 hypothetical protein [Caproicibacter fermentans]QNK41806.1 hypothetical protein HCR03_06060 [Caproicibacter fermentans]
MTKSKTAFARNAYSRNEAVSYYGDYRLYVFAAATLAGGPDVSCAFQQTGSFLINIWMN